MKKIITLILLLSFSVFSFADESGEINQKFFEHCFQSDEPRCKIIVQQIIENSEKACQAHNAEQCFRLGMAYSGTVYAAVSKNEKKAYQYYKKACDKGHTKACTALSKVYMTGQGVKVDYQKAKQLAEKACDDGDDLACSNLGFLYKDGKGVSQDTQKAKELYQKSCHQNKKNAVACNNLGVLYLKEKNYQAARPLLEFSCNQNYLKACYSLATMYADGLGVKQNTKKTVQLLNKACPSDSPYLAFAEPEACFYLGLIYHDGVGIKKDATKAQTFFQIACDLEYTDACHIRNNSEK